MLEFLHLEFLEGFNALDEINHNASLLSTVTAIEGNFTQWSEWSECSATCGEGQQSRVRECTNPKPSFGGRNCSHIGEPVETRPCSKMACEGKEFQGY